MPQHKASCLCGQPDRVGLCHCLDCRKHHGPLFFAAAIFPAATVTIEGETRAWPICERDRDRDTEGHVAE